MTRGSPAVLLLVVLSGCGTPDTGTKGAPSPTSPTRPAPTTAPRTTAPPATAAAPTPSSASSSRTDLVVESRDAPAAPVVVHRLRCDPAGGDHPRPRAACRDVAAAAAALAPAPADELCTQQYGGPQTARISGTYRGRQVDVRLDRTDGCAIARWEALGDVLPPLD